MTQKEKIKQLEAKVEQLEQRLNFLLGQQAQIGHENVISGWFPIASGEQFDANKWRIASENHGTLGMGNELFDYEPFTIGYLKQAADVPGGKSAIHCFTEINEKTKK